MNPGIISEKIISEGLIYGLILDNEYAQLNITIKL